MTDPIASGSTKQEKPERAPTPPIIKFGLPAAVALIVGAWTLVVMAGNSASLGQAGDAMAPLTGIATACALFYAIWSTSLQRDELALQRKEMQDATAVQKEIVGRQEMLAKAQQDAANALLRAAVAQERVLDMDLIARLHAECAAKNEKIEAASKDVERAVTHFLNRSNVSKGYAEFMAPLVDRRHSFQGSYPVGHAQRQVLVERWRRRIAIETEAERAARLSEMLEVAAFYDRTVLEIVMLSHELKQRSD